MSPLDGLKMLQKRVSYSDREHRVAVLITLRRVFVE